MLVYAVIYEFNELFEFMLILALFQKFMSYYIDLCFIILTYVELSWNCITFFFVLLFFLCFTTFLYVFILLFSFIYYGFILCYIM